VNTASCVLLADRHHALAEGVRDLLAAEFASVFTVGDEASLLEGAEQLKPRVVVVDLKFAQGDLAALLAGISRRSPASKIVVLTVHDEPSVARAALRAGAHGVVLKRAISTDLVQAIDEVLAGRDYLSPGTRD
jgi:DNA-binding NarL/FixJ family response regulator